ncbi:MAG: hypothetical protein ACR2OL_14375 [Anderseniella sp.]
MKSTKLISLLVCFFVASAAANAQKKSEGRELAELGFAAVDAQSKGFAHIGDLEAYRKLVFVSMDANDDKKVDLNEFLGWDYGFHLIAEEQGKKNAYLTSKKVIFHFWDRNGDGFLAPAEHRKAIIADFQRADLNNDAILSKEEFIRNFSIMAAMRAALKD